MKVGVIGAGTMGQGIAKAFAMVDGYEEEMHMVKEREEKDRMALHQPFGLREEILP